MTATPTFTPTTFDQVQRGDVVRITTKGQKRRQTIRVREVKSNTILPCFNAYRARFDRDLGDFVSYGNDHFAIVYPSSSLEVANREATR